jgi:hypothetical protein
LTGRRYRSHTGSASARLPSPPSLALKGLKDVSETARSWIYNVACLAGGAFAVNWLLQLWPMPIFPLWGCAIVIALTKPVDTY